MDVALDLLEAADVQKSDKEITCRLSIHTSDEWEEALQLFSEMSATSWNVYKSFPKPERYKFRKRYVCHHNQRRPKGNSWKTNTKCPAEIDVKIKYATINTRYKDKYVDSHPCVMVIKGHHNHSLESAESLGQLKLTGRAKAVLFKCYESGMSPSQVYHWLQADELAGELFSTGGNRKLRSLTYCWEKWQKETPYYEGEEIFDAIENFAKISDADIVFKRFDECFVCVLITPLMARVHAHIKQASEIVFVDTTSRIDRTDSSMTVLFCASRIGALPLGVIVTNGQDEQCYHEGFCILKEKIGDSSFFGSKSSVFMTNDNVLEKNALVSMWPKSVQLLRTSHVLKAVWRWLLDCEHIDDNIARQTLMQKFKDILFSSTAEEADWNYNELSDKCAELGCEIFLMYVTKWMDRRHEWCIADMEDLVRDHNANSFSEATFHIIKDVIFNRCKAYNAFQVVRRVVDIFSPYMQERLINAALGKPKTPSSNSPILGEEKIIKHSKFRFEVASDDDDDDEVENYHVDIESSVCSCSVGFRDEICKHRRSVLIQHFLKSEYWYDGTPTERRKLAVIAVGATKVPHISFFQDCIDFNNVQSVPAAEEPQDATLPTSTQSVSPAERLQDTTLPADKQSVIPAEQLQDTILPADKQSVSPAEQFQVTILTADEHQSLTSTDQFLNTNTPAPSTTNYAEPETPQQEIESSNVRCELFNEDTTDTPLASCNKRLYQEIINLLKIVVDIDTAEANSALKECKSILLQLKNSSQSNSYNSENVKIEIAGTESTPQDVFPTPACDNVPMESNSDDFENIEIEIAGTDLQPGHVLPAPTSDNIGMVSNTQSNLDDIENIRIEIPGTDLQHGYVLPTPAGINVPTGITFVNQNAVMRPAQGHTLPIPSVLNACITSPSQNICTQPRIIVVGSAGDCIPNEFCSQNICVLPGLVAPTFSSNISPSQHNSLNQNIPMQPNLIVPRPAGASRPRILAPKPVGGSVANGEPTIGTSRGPPAKRRRKSANRARIIPTNAGQT